MHDEASEPASRRQLTRASRCSAEAAPSTRRGVCTRRRRLDMPRHTRGNARKDVVRIRRHMRRTRRRRPKEGRDSACSLERGTQREAGIDQRSRGRVERTRQAARRHVRPGMRPRSTRMPLRIHCKPRYSLRCGQDPLTNLLPGFGLVHRPYRDLARADASFAPRLPTRPERISIG